MDLFVSRLYNFKFGPAVRLFFDPDGAEFRSTRFANDPDSMCHMGIESV